MFDYDYILKDSGAVTSSGYGTVDSEAQVLNLGEGLIRGNVHIEVGAMKMNNNNQLYQIHLMGGDDSDFTNQVALASIELGCREVIEGTKDSKLGRYILPFENEQNGVIYPYVRVRHTIGGTSPSINYVARLEKDLPVLGRTTQITTTTTTT